MKQPVLSSPPHTWPRVEIKGGDEFSKKFQTPGGGGQGEGNFLTQGGERVVTPIFYWGGERVGTHTKSQGG